MAAPGGYGAQINMTQPVALLVLLALMSAVATGLFWWLKRQLGDRTRHDLAHAVTNLTDHIRSGYDRGQRGYERGRDLYQHGRQRLGRDDDRDDPDAPLTGSPAPGRPPGGGRSAPAAPSTDPAAPGQHRHHQSPPARPPRQPKPAPPWWPPRWSPLSQSPAKHNAASTTSAAQTAALTTNTPHTAPHARRAAMKATPGQTSHRNPPRAAPPAPQLTSSRAATTAPQSTLRCAPSSTTTMRSKNHPRPGRQ